MSAKIIGIIQVKGGAGRSTVAYSEALGSGLTVAELPDQNFRMEMRFLTAELKAILRKR